MPISETLKTIVWKPSGGLGHCLHNLAWTIDLCEKRKCKLLIYRFDLHTPFQYHASDFLEFKNKQIEIEEIKNEEDFDKCCKDYKITKENQQKIYTAGYNTGIKYLVQDKSVAVICSTWSKLIKNYLYFKKSFIESLLVNPTKFYNNDYPLLLKSKKKNKDEFLHFSIQGSYTNALAVQNRHLKIGKDDKDYINELKTLKIKYKDAEGNEKTVDCLEKTNHSINNITEIVSAHYGVKDKVNDVTHIVKRRLVKKGKFKENKETLLDFAISGSFYEVFRVTNKQLGITKEDKEHFNVKKELTLKYKDINDKVTEEKIKEKDTKEIKNIKDIISAKYGVGTKLKDVKEKVIKKCCIKKSISPAPAPAPVEKELTLEEHKEKIKEIINSGKYIAVHFRFRDKKVGGGYKKKLREIKDAINKTGIQNVYVATDSPMFFDYLGENLPNTTIFRYTNPPKDGKNIHYNTSVFKKGENLYKTLLDLTVCKKSHRFIPSVGSGFSNICKEI